MSTNIPNLVTFRLKMTTLLSKVVFLASIFPDNLKLAVVLHLLKKLLLNIEDKKNYQPVSNLLYVGKLVEKVAVKRFRDNVTENNLDEL